MRLLALTLMLLVVDAGDVVDVDGVAGHTEQQMESSREVLNSVDEGGFSYLARAAREGQHELVESYIKFGADVNYKHKKTYHTPIMYAVERGHYLAVNAFIMEKEKVKLETYTKEGFNPLQLAIAGNFSEIAHLLLMAGANPNAISYHVDHAYHNHDGKSLPGITAAMMACLVSSLPVLERLHEFHANFGAKSAHGGDNALMYAAVGGNAALVAFMLEHNLALIDDTNKAGLTALMLAASRGHTHVVELLLRHNATVNLKDEVGLNALDYSIDQQQDAARDLLYMSGSEVGFYRSSYPPEVEERRGAVLRERRRLQQQEVERRRKVERIEGRADL